jgi:hypothetical protein
MHMNKISLSPQVAESLACVLWEKISHMLLPLPFAVWRASTGSDSQALDE